MKEDPEVIEYIEQFSPEFRKILYRLRELIRGIVPESTEAIKAGVPAFGFRKKSICLISGHKNHVTLAFINGTMLRDPDEILLGSGKFMRHIKFKTLVDIDEEQVKIWILEGFYT